VLESVTQRLVGRSRRRAILAYPKNPVIKASGRQEGLKYGQAKLGAEESMLENEDKASGHLTFATGLLGCVLLTIVLLVWSAWRFPESLTNGPWFTPVGACGALFAYAAVAAPHRPSFALL